MVENGVKISGEWTGNVRNSHFNHTKMCLCKIKFSLNQIQYEFQRITESTKVFEDEVDKNVQRTKQLAKMEFHLFSSFY